eukprot:CAMPEP_0203844926 /NCGR_PEP_ID=MMETSP0359-20131031/3505_1 /ASSEMBLY_ACC=CAM_ASM_000338 /TAXON_ID=268821 /ORGANISM="Scrippsiella Hangoei, Strain SHTV-5" /LENGTH=424 /DNA_ID=CAMNT_0050759973 /DNA_START=14 /DNA_END=1289 /DNA_ORIENTATION=+
MKPPQVVRVGSKKAGTLPEGVYELAPSMHSAAAGFGTSLPSRWETSMLASGLADQDIFTSALGSTPGGCGSTAPLQASAAELGAATTVGTWGSAGALRESSRGLLREFYHDSRQARQQLDAKRSDLLTVMRALEKVERELREALHDRQSKHGEVRLLRQQTSSLQSNSEEGAKQLQEAEQQVENLQERRAGSDRQARAAEERCAHLESQLKAVEAAKLQALQRREQAELHSSERVRLASEAEARFQQQADLQVQAAQQAFSEADTRRKEQGKRAILELQTLSQSHQLLKCELKRMMRPPAVVIYVPPPMPAFPSWGPAAGLHFGSDEDFARTRARVSVARGCDRRFNELLPAPSGYSRGSLLDGRVKTQAELVLSHLSQMNDSEIEAADGVMPPRSAEPVAYPTSGRVSPCPEVRREKGGWATA